MTSRTKPFAGGVDPGDRRFYSLNILLADYEPIRDLARDEALIAHKQPSTQLGTRDFAESRFHKHITTPLGPVHGAAAGEPAPAPAPDVAAPARAEPGQYFVPWACCLPVEGATRSILCDLQRGTFTFIPNVVVEILELCRTLTVEQIYAHYEHQHDAQIDEYFAHLIAHDYGMFTGEPQRFPPLGLDWRNPRPITNCVIDFAEGTEQPLASIAAQLSGLFCQAVELRFFRAVSAAELTAHVAAFADSTIRSISVLAGYHPSLDREAIDQLLRLHKRVKHVAVHSTPDHDEIIRVDLHTTLRFTREAVTSEACCGQASARYFSCHVETVTEALAHNSCLNRKLGIDARGAIKNCPSMARSFGDARTTPLADVASHEDFQALWKITKDQVTGCQDCEFRYICHDCRAYLADPAQPLSKPAKCCYDPYAGRWAED